MFFSTKETMVRFTDEGLPSRYSFISHCKYTKKYNFTKCVTQNVNKNICKKPHPAAPPSCFLVHIKNNSESFVGASLRGPPKHLHQVLKQYLHSEAYQDEAGDDVGRALRHGNVALAEVDTQQ